MHHEEFSGLLLGAMVRDSAILYQRISDKAEFPELDTASHLVQFLIGVASGASSQFIHDITKYHHEHYDDLFRQKPELEIDPSLQILSLGENLETVFFTAEDAVRDLLIETLFQRRLKGDKKSIANSIFAALTESMTLPITNDYQKLSVKMRRLFAANIILLWLESRGVFDVVLTGMIEAIPVDPEDKIPGITSRHEYQIMTHIVLALHHALEVEDEAMPWDWLEPVVVSQCVDNLANVDTWSAAVAYMTSTL